MARIYKTFAYVVTNTLLLFVFINFAFGAYYWMKRAPVSKPAPGPNREHGPKPTAKRTQYQLDWVDLRGYEGEEPARVDKILDDFYELSRNGFVFRPYVHFSEPPVTTETLNVAVDRYGFEYRKNGKDTRPLASKDDRPIFVLGGSTTFGYNVADDSTIPARLETILGKETVNYGRGFYSWFQELVLLERLIEAGHRPRAVIFIDGVNQPRVGGAPPFSDEMARLWDHGQSPEYEELFTEAIPVLRFLNRARRQNNDAVFAKRYPAPPSRSLDERVAWITQSYVSVTEARAAVAKSIGAAAYFYWQPSRVHDCGEPPEKWPAEWRDAGLEMKGSYEAMQGLQLPGYRFLGGLCREHGEGHFNFVDRVHYGPKFNDVIARAVASDFAPR